MSVPGSQRKPALPDGPLAPCKLRRYFLWWTKPRNGETPVPGPIMTTGLTASSGWWKSLEGFGKMGTSQDSPDATASAIPASQFVATPRRVLPPPVSNSTTLKAK